MPTDPNEESKKILAEILGDDSEGSPTPKKEDKNPFKDKKNDESNTYEYEEDPKDNDDDW